MVSFVWKITAGFSALVLATIPSGFLAEPIAVGLIGAVAALLLLLSLWGLKPGERDFFHSLIGPYLCVGLSVAAVGLLQILPLPFAAHPVWASAAEALDSPVRGTISIAPGDSLGALLLVLTALSAFACSAAISIDARRAKWLVDSVMLVTVVLSILLVAQSFLGAFASSDTARVGVAELLIGLPVALSRGLEAFHQARVGRTRAAARYAMLCLGAAVLIVVSALSMAPSSARVPVGVAIALVILIWLSRRSKIPAFASLSVTTALAVIGAGSAIALFKDRSDLSLVVRFSQAPMEALQTAQTLIADLPWLGTGLGTYPLLLPTYAGLTAPEATSAASVALAEIGAPLFWAMCAIALLASISFYRGAVTRGRDWSFSTAAAAMIPTLLVAAFIMPFELSPEHAIMLAAALGAGASQRFSRARNEPG